jgi:hypothetical protein
VSGELYGGQDPIALERAEPCVHADRARLEMVEQLHVAVFGSTWARPETPKQVWEMLLARVGEEFKR